ncbi:hypothetical protein ASPTUDRAFT_122468 [Aspergillus tubingensis CBS 134.48]|uniref:Cytochrome P450 n=1 Tax=Aspergillus tubingensis (strain CBS 134.48) TaxID=767770 RepID=A0A1L9N5D5_ASPTC|nr:hypothetical protein ASPTUDRAFT_122468 [Aspergillus tubingensis CBS 134.48]
MTSKFTFIATCVSLFLLARMIYGLLLDPLRKIPGPVSARFTRLFLKIAVLRGRRSQYIHDLHQKYGHIVRIAPEEIAIANLETFRTIHQIGSGYQKAPWYLKFVTSPRPGIFAMTDPRDHAARRKAFAQGFANTSILKFELIVREKVELAVSKIQRDAEVGNADILKWFTFMATDIAGELSFGRSFDMLQLERKTQYIRDLEVTMMISGVRAELGWLFSLLRWLPLKAMREALSLPGRLQGYGQQAIENHRTHLLENDNPTLSLLSRFLDPKNTQGLPIDDIAVEASNMIIAGSDTTSISLTYLIWALLRPRNRKVKERVLQEIRKFPVDASPSDFMRSKYLRAVVNEALRLYGAAPSSLPRTTPLSGAQLGGYNIPGGTTVSTQAFSIHRDPLYFPGPETFDPDRWLSQTPEMNAAFHPFGAGSRVCIGMHLAMLELFTGLVIFFLKCPTARLAPSTTEDSMKFENYFLVAPISHRCEIMLC